jgi:hypothetical protein
MIIISNPAEYIVDVGRETHLACARHTGGIIHMAPIADVHVNIIELDTSHMFHCEVCDLMESQGQPCH